MGKYFNNLAQSVQNILDNGLAPFLPSCPYGTHDNEHNLEFELENLLYYYHKFTRISNNPLNTHSHKYGQKTGFCCLIKSRKNNWTLEALNTSSCQFSPVNNISLEIDIICGKSSDILCIELKKIYYNPTPSSPHSSHDYNYLYGISTNLAYTIPRVPSTFGCGYNWRGGPFLYDNSKNDLLSFFQEGQIWWDIARLIEIKKHYPNSERYLVGFVKLANGTKVRGMCDRLDKIVKTMQSWPNLKEVYNVYNRILQKYKYNDFSYVLKCLYPSSGNPLNMAMGYVIEIT